MPDAAVRRSRRYESWNRYPEVEHREVVCLHWRSDVPAPESLGGSVLPYGRGRSYGDTCLNGGGTLLDTRGLSRFIAFDRAAGVVRCEAGVTMGEILDVTVPAGWFLAVTPGTRHVSVGGAVAHDVHGKNHHRMGTFGCHVRRLEVLRTGGERTECSPDANGDLFRATLGGMGLTGLVLWAELELQPVSGPAMEARGEEFHSLEGFFERVDDADDRSQYTVAWLDALARTPRGILFSGDHAGDHAGDHSGDHSGDRFRGAHAGDVRPGRDPVRVPVDAPPWLLNRWTARVFNALYRRRHAATGPHLEHYDAFFYPLDSVAEWNRLYGKRGFVQHQCVVPPDGSRAVVGRLLRAIRESGETTLLAVLKKFGSRASPGWMSFPRPGTTLSVDFPLRGPSTHALLDLLDTIVVEAGGAIYPAKDARMSPATFRASFPRWREFDAHVDPSFSSTFWRRVTDAGGGRP